MTSSTAASPRRLMLVPSVPRTERGDGVVRRYRLARLHLEGPEAARQQRFAQSKRSYD
jgi:hypothetical protein